MINETEGRRESLRKTIQSVGPARTLVNQGGNTDATAECSVLRESQIAYDILCHNATAWTWPSQQLFIQLRKMFESARRALFVSHDNLKLTEAQIAKKIDQGEVIYNPTKFSGLENIPMRTKGDCMNLACVARLSCRQKGQDLILQVLSLPKWKNREILVTFYGDGPHRQGLEEYSSALDLKSTRFAGHVGDVRKIWEENHFFIQPSRFEGYGLSLVEAMFCQRAAIATPFPSAKEFIRDGETGFLARGVTVEELDDVMERAWQERLNWRALGEAAGKRVADGYPQDPVKQFIDQIKI